MDQRAIILLSGGVDSATAGAIAVQTGFRLYALTVDYGQRHRRELDAARKVAKSLPAREHILQRVDLRAFGQSALTDDLEVPRPGSVEAIGKEIPVTYVPARNTILLALALAYAESRNCRDIFIGVNALDYSGYPDCRPAFVQAFERLANLGTKAGVSGASFQIHAPLLHMNKAEIIREGHRLGVDFGLTLSCYDPTEDGLACGACDSCLLRRKGFNDAGIPDPARYVR